MHDVLRQRLLRRIESLPEDQVYQVLDYIEFLESKYVKELRAEASGLQRFAEGLEDRLRKKALSPNTLREAFQLIAAADRVLSSVSSAGRQIINELGTVPEGVGEGTAVGKGDFPGEEGGVQGVEASREAPPLGETAEPGPGSGLTPPQGSG